MISRQFLHTESVVGRRIWLVAEAKACRRHLDEQTLETSEPQPQRIEGVTMLFRQYPDREPVVAVSYLLGCPKKGIGSVVDPVGDVGRYLKESEAATCRSAT